MPDNADAKEIHWELLITAESDVQAQMIVEVLDEAGIPALTQSPTAGVFGYGFAAATPQGIVISVPSDWLAEAKERIDSAPGLDLVQTTLPNDQ